MYSKIKPDMNRTTNHSLYQTLLLVMSLLVFCFLIPTASFAGINGKISDRSLPIFANDEVYRAAPAMDLFEDKTGQLNINDIVGSKFDGKFKANVSKSFNFGVTSSVFWLRFQISAVPGFNEKERQVRVLELGEAFADRIDWRLYSETGELMASGGSLEGKDTYAVINASLKPESYYLSAGSTTSFMFNPRFFTFKSYFAQTKIISIWYGIFFGIIIAVMFYNLFLFFSFNDRSYLWYVLHLAFVIIYFAGINGLTLTLLMPDNSELSGMLNRSFLGLMLVFMILLTRSFLMTRIKTPKIDKLLVTLFFAAWAMSLLNLFFPARFIVTLLIVTGILSPLMIIIAAFFSLKSGFKPARLFMVAWALFLIGVILFALTSSGAIVYNFITFNAFQTGTGVAAILLSIALGDRIRVLRQEHTSFKQSMERVTMILDSIESGVLLIDSKDRKVIEINQSAQKIIGDKRENIIGKPGVEYIHMEPDENGSIGDIHDSAQHPAPSEDHREDVLINAAGEKIPILKRARMIELDGHDLILGSFVDISNLRRVEESLRKSEAKFRSLFDSSRDAIMILDQGSFIDCNPAALKMFGCTQADEFVGQTPSDFSPLLQTSGHDSSSEMLNHINTALDRGSLFFEWEHKRLDGDPFPVETMLSKVDVGGRQMLQASVRDITQRKRMEDELKRLASTDPLTGADNRRSFLKKGTQELLRAKRYKHPFSLFMIDVDHFKKVNDTHGHNCGDEVLKALVIESCRILRSSDLFGRMGGEEFAVILPETDLETAIEVADRLRLGLSKLRVEAETNAIDFTVSIGLTTLKEETDTIVAVMGRADKALYMAKENGRNRLVEL
jgi:diguanylate cyclase (GGDEF)-like protein/PAS domain S-box-containing protein